MTGKLPTVPLGGQMGDPSGHPRWDGLRILPYDFPVERINEGLSESDLREIGRGLAHYFAVLPRNRRQACWWWLRLRFQWPYWRQTRLIDPLWSWWVNRDER